jgi:hypothetical protein
MGCDQIVRTHHRPWYGEGVDIVILGAPTPWTMISLKAADHHGEAILCSGAATSEEKGPEKVS